MNNTQLSKKARPTHTLIWLFLCLICATNLCHANLQTSQEKFTDITAQVSVEFVHADTRTRLLALLELTATQFPRRSGDQLMAETNTIGNSLSQVSRVGSLLLGEVRGGVAQHLDQDAFNSVIVTTLSDGTVPGRLSYRAFGQVRSLTGNVATPFRFNGYVTDGGDELSSPSRFYSMGTGRFTSMDPAAPTAMDPLTWNAYVGLGANPMHYVDPTGRYQRKPPPKHTLPI